MGIFDRLKAHKNPPLTPQGGLVLAAITMVAADGDVDDDELAVIRRLDGSGSTVAWETAMATYKASSVRECVALAAAAMNPRQQRVALANLVDIAMADGVLAGAEKDLLEAYVDAFDVGEADINKMVEVIGIKNNREVFA